MNTKKMIGLLLSSIFVLFLFLNATTPSPTTKGEDIYKTNCSACHQPTGAGIPGAFPPLAKSDYLAKMSKTQAITIVLQGKTGEITVNGAKYNSVMAPLASLSDADVAAVLTYVSNNFENKGHKYTAGDVKKVRSTLK